MTETMTQQTNPQPTKLAENPFVGPKPFSGDDTRRFYGRERESRDLLSLVVSERIVLFYAMSGAGKTSLINASLIPNLRERGFHVLPVGRVSGESQGGVKKVDNIFIYDLLLSLEGKNANEAELANLRLPDYLDSLDIPSKHAGANGDLTGDGLTPLVLIIDQFEEIFTNHPGEWEKREDFFNQVAEAVENDPYLWVMFAIREDYVAGLDRYAHLLPGQMRGRYYMQRMRRDAAIRAVVEPARDIRPIDQVCAAEVVKNLLQIQTSEPLAEGQKPQLAEFVEPVQLQVVCLQLWERAAQEQLPQLNMDVLPGLLDNRSLAEFVTQALGDFYESVITFTLDTMRERGQPISQRKLRAWFSNNLITPAGTRAFVFRSGQDVEGMPYDVVRLLTSRFIIRSETRASATWFELVHDRMVDPILRANETWRNIHMSQLEKDAATWHKASNPALLYKGLLLREAEKHLEIGELEPEEEEFIRESQKVEKQELERARQRRQATITGLVVLLLMIILSAWALQQRSEADYNRVIAERERITAEAARVEAEQQRNAARTAVADAEQRRQEADAARSDAQQKQTEADQARAEVVAAEAKLKESLDQSLNTRLAAYAEYYGVSGQNADLGLLLSVAALRFDTQQDQWETYKALSTALWGAFRGQPFEARLDRDAIPSTAFLQPNDKVFGLDFSPDGKQLAVAGQSGLVTLWDIGSAQPLVAPPPLRTNWRVYDMQYSPDGSYLATGGSEGVVRLLDRTTSEMYTTFDPPWSVRVYVHQIAFSPDSRYLAAGMGNGWVLLYNVPEKRLEAQRFERSGDVWSLAWSSDSTKLAYGGKNGTVSIWDLTKDPAAVPQQLVGALNSTVDGLAWSPDGRYIYAGGQGKLLVRWDTYNDVVVARSRRDVTPAIFSLDINPTGTTLITGNGSSITPVMLWDAESLTPVAFPDEHKFWSRAVVFDPTGSYLATGGDDAAVFLWRIRALEPLAKPLGRIVEGGITTMAVDPRTDEPVFIRTSGSALRKFFQLYGSDFKALGVQVAMNFNALAMGKIDGKLALAAGAPGQVQLVEPNNGGQLAEPLSLPRRDRDVGALAFSADNQMLGAAVCADETLDFRSQFGYCKSSQLYIWDLSAKPARPLAVSVLLPDALEPGEIIANDITALAISAPVEGSQDRHVVLGYRYGSEGRIYMGTLTPDPDGQSAQVVLLADSSVSAGLLHAIVFNPDGKTFITGSDAGDIRAWHTDSHQLYSTLGIEERITGAEEAVPIGGLAFFQSADGLRLFSVTQAGAIREWNVDLQSLAQRACGMVSPSLDEAAEWEKLFPDAAKPAAICPYP